MKATPFRTALRLQRRHLFQALDDCQRHPRHWRMPNVFATCRQPAWLTALVRRYQQQRGDAGILYVACHQVRNANDFLRAIAAANGTPAPRNKYLVDSAARNSCRRLGATLLVLDGLALQALKKGETRRLFFATLTSLMEDMQIPFCCTGPKESLYLCWADEGARSRFHKEWAF